ncbi:MAG TPA: helix-turn-helix domain-containing protein [Cryobacterium sp.]|nr:helix-turn-helix domain-containing protein [Cryobacterium sp.]
MINDDGSGDRHAALASDARREVLELLMGSATPLDAAAVAARIGLHVTTARFHLEQLENAGLIRRAVGRAGTRGRPRILFTAGPAAREDGSQHDLSRVLATALAEDADRGRARAIRAGETWAESYADELRGSASRGLAPLMRILDRLGFDPALDEPSPEPEPAPKPASDPASDPASESDPESDVAPVVSLLACPFRADARDAPEVICSVHLGLVRGVARELGHDPDQVGLRPFVRPELCLLHLGSEWVEPGPAPQ